MRRYAIILFVTMCLAQWYVPAAMILDQEAILKNGKVFRFRTAPVDPYDPFRGKYITLRFEADTCKNIPGQKWEMGESAFALLREDDNGFAYIESLSETEPDPENDYVRVRILFSADDIIRVSYPFDRFYLEESKAHKAEQVYSESNRNDSTQNAYAVVRIRNGKPALENVMINDRSIMDVVRENR